MVTKPVPIWQRWLATPKGRERAYKYYYIGMILVNVTIVIGVILFLILFYFRTQ